MSTSPTAAAAAAALVPMAAKWRQRSHNQALLVSEAPMRVCDGSHLIENVRFVVSLSL